MPSTGSTPKVHGLVGTHQTEAHRQAISDGVRGWWATRTDEELRQELLARLARLDERMADER
jgi:hypothetical protein